MATPGQFRFSIREPNGQYYTVNSAGAVVTSAQPAYIESPIGWNQTEIKWMRNPVYWGIGRTITTPYKVHSSAAKIIKYLFLTQGIEAKAEFRVEIRQNPSWTYGPYYSGEIDFSKYDGEQRFVTINILEADLQAILKANERIPQEIPILNGDCLRVNTDGVALLNSASFLMSNSPFGNNTNVANVPKLTLITTETGDKQDVQEVEYSDVSSLNYTGKYFYKASTPSQITVEYNFTIRANALPGLTYAGAMRVGFFVRDNNNNLTQTIDVLIVQDAINYLGTTYTLQGSFQINVQQGDQLYFRSAGPNLLVWNYGTITDPNNPGNTQPSLRVRYSSRFPATVTRWYRYHQVVAKMTAAIFGQAAVGNSYVLTNPGLSRSAMRDSRPFNALIGSGDSLRGLGNGADDPAKIKTTFADLFKDASSQWSLAMTDTNKQIAFVPLADVFRDVEIANLGLVSNMKTAPYNEVFFNSLKVGYQERDYDQLNGRFEFNQGQSYSLQFTRTLDESDQTSSFRADPYGMEFTRINLVGKTTTDAGSDNDVFLLDISDNAVLGVWNIYRPQTPLNTTGLLFPLTTYNLALSPKRKLLRGSRLLAAIMMFRQKSIKFKTADKNADITSNLGSGLVNERADVSGADLTNPLFRPILFRFTTKVPRNMITLMQTMPHGYFSFMWKGKLLKGFPMEVGTKPAYPQQYDFTLLCHPGVDVNDI